MCSVCNRGAVSMQVANILADSGKVSLTSVEDLIEYIAEHIGAFAASGTPTAVLCESRVCSRLPLRFAADVHIALPRIISCDWGLANHSR